jgi:hypothetical protein
MTDELTPEEKDLLAKLPRERMPTPRLEGRVVEAMREHGFLARRRRTLELTGGRVAGVLAAGFALMIGAYSIGLHRGDGRDVLVPVSTAPRDDLRLPQTPASGALRERDRLAADEGLEAEQPAAADAGKESTAEPKVATSPAPRATSEEATTGLVDQPKPEVVGPRERSAPEAAPPTQKALPQAASQESAGRVHSLSTRVEAVVAAPRSRLTFVLDGSHWTVEADSVRVVEEGRGRVLLIYTSDGVIRVPLADD